MPSPTDGLMVSFEIHQSCASAGVVQASGITPVNLYLGQGTVVVDMSLRMPGMHAVGFTMCLLVSVQLYHNHYQ